MTLHAPPPKVTGGGGFDFESKVAAHFLACLLTDRTPFEPQLGSIAHIDFQVRADGWLFDDLLLTLRAPAREVRCAVSIKSNSQFGIASAPNDFVKDLWAQYLHIYTPAFNKDSDYICLITTPLGQIKGDLDWLLGIARDQPSDSIPNRIRQPGYAARARVQLFESFACPANWAQTYGVDEGAIGTILGRVKFRSFDFESSISGDESSAVALCREALLSGATDDAVNLWEALQVTATECRAHGGRIRLQQLLDNLRGRFALKRLPNYVEDAARFSSYSRDYLNTITDSIGGTVALPRISEQQAIAEALRDRRLVVVLGETGVGKSALAKRFVDDMDEASTAFWVPPELVQERFGSLKLRFAVEELIASETSAGALLVVDSLDRLFDLADFQRVASLLNALRLTEGGSPWRVVLVCQTQEWARVQANLHRFEIKLPREIPEIEVGFLSANDLQVVADQIPTMRLLLVKDRVRDLLSRPKYLDFAVRLKETVRDTDSAMLSECDLINGFWRVEIAALGPAVERLMLLLAETQGDDLQNEISLQRIPDPIYLQSLRQLETARVCFRQHDNSAIRFAHDVIGDWARFRSLVGSNIDGLPSSRLESPLWHRAVRLYALSLLEQGDVAGWSGLVSKGSDSAPSSPTLVSDLALESVIFAADAHAILTQLWDTLRRAEGKLLKRFLARFAIVGTRPDPRMLALLPALKGVQRTEVEATWRVPIAYLWPPVIALLRDHIEEALEFVPREAAQLAEKWLNQDRMEAMKQQAAEIATKGALRIVGSDSHWHDKETSKAVFQALFAAAGSMPAESIEVLLMAAGRLQPPPRPIAKPTPITEERKARMEALRPFMALRSAEIEVGPWPDGPRWQRERAFEEFVQEYPYCLAKLVSIDAERAKEIYLATLIREPGARPADRGSWRRYEETEIERSPHDFPPFYNRGAFLIFLSLAPKHGVDLIVRLVNFATERWAQTYSEDGNVAPAAMIGWPNGDTEWIGDDSIYFAYRDVGEFPDAAVSALMALEYWLAKNIEEKKEVAEYIALVIAASKSLAFAGLLIGIGKRSPDLFLGQLKPLLLVPEFYYWEQIQQVKGEGHQMIGWTSTRSVANVKAASEWHGLTVRRIELSDVAVRLYLLAPSLRADLEKVAQLCLEKAATAGNNYYRKIASFFNTDNWIETQDQAGQKGWEYRAPAELVAIQTKFETDHPYDWLLLNFPIQCVRLLDDGKQLDGDALANFVQVAEKVRSLPDQSGPELIESAGDAKVAAASVLVVLCQTWMDSQPDVAEWSRHVILERSGSHDYREDDLDEGIASWRGDRHCARALPLLWAAKPDDPLLREGIAALVMNNHYETVQFLFAASATVRHKLGVDFLRMYELLFRWASTRAEITEHGYRDHLNRASMANRMKRIWNRGWAWVRALSRGRRPYTLGEWHDHRMEKDYTRKFGRWRASRLKRLRPAIARFIDGSLSTSTVGWGARGIDPNQIQRSSDRREGTFYQRHPMVDERLIQAGFEWLFPAKLSSDPDVAQLRQTTCKEGVTLLCWQLGNGDPRIEEIDGTPYQFDRWILRAAGRHLPTCSSAQEAAELWKPLLQIGASAHYWVEDFLHSWFMNLFEEVNVERFAETWGAMVQFALASDGWTGKRGHRSYRLQQLWNHLLAIDNLMLTVWEPEREALVLKMRGSYEAWAKANLGFGECVEAFLRFVITTPARSLRIPALGWLDDALVGKEDGFWYDRDKDIEENLARLLDLINEHARRELRASDESWAIFKKLVRVLAEKQNPVALVLLEKIATA